MQTRKHSLLEVTCSTLAGFVIAMLTQLVVAEVYNLQTSFNEDFTIVLIFTIVSIIRGYIFRRIFNRLARRTK